MQNKINKSTMVQSVNVILAIDKAHSLPQQTLDCRASLDHILQLCRYNSIIANVICYPTLSDLICVYGR